MINDRDRSDLQEDLKKKPSDWFERLEMPCNVHKCHIIQVGTRKQKFDNDKNEVKIYSVHCVKDLAVSIASNLKFS